MSPKQETATSTLKHELLYYLSTSSITRLTINGPFADSDVFTLMCL